MVYRRSAVAIDHGVVGGKERCPSVGDVLRAGEVGTSMCLGLLAATDVP